MSSNPSGLDPGTPGVAPPLTAGSGLAGIGGASFGPIGQLLGGALGTVGGGFGSLRAGESLDPVVEADYWRRAHLDRPYIDGRFHFDTDYLPAYRFGAERRAESVPAPWDDALEAVLHEEWLHRRANSALTWAQARAAVRDAWDRVDRTYRLYQAADRYHERRFEQAVYREPSYSYGDYRPAHRYGTWARAAQPARDWDDLLEQELERGWQRAKGNSRLSWERARAAVQDAWQQAEQAASVGGESGEGARDPRANGSG